MADITDDSDQISMNLETIPPEKGFPWWILLLLGGTVVGVVVLIKEKKI